MYLTLLCISINQLIIIKQDVSVERADYIPVFYFRCILLIFSVFILPAAGGAFTITLWVAVFQMRSHLREDLPTCAEPCCVLQLT